jgi:hypothetical protein
MQKTGTRHNGVGRLFTGLLASGLCLIPALPQAAQTEAVTAADRAAAPTATLKASPYRPLGQPDSANDYYQSMWGVDNFLVRRTASGNLIRFSYRVTDPVRARQLGDRTATPYMIGVRSRAVLQVPIMDKVGPLRQSTKAMPGQEYWMVFSNKGDLVKSGDRVNVVIGAFRADGLVVE